ncbi:hypothetical protein B0H14DRAFT_3560026 [Mycena olivaceomarginata]|nr:hypothetical protein B0H14DRAFT_3560026 [Mycena olivaceomarginata]
MQRGRCGTSASRFEVGTLDADKLALAVLLRSLCPELRSIREKWEDDDKTTPSDVVKSLEKEKLRWEEEMKPKLAEERANAARGGRPPPANSAGRGLCETCKGPHHTDECWGPGGAMQGRRNEVLARRAARQAGKQPDKPANTSKDTKADAPAAKAATRPRLVLKDGNGKTVYFTITDDDSETAASTLTGVSSNAELEENYNTYHAILRTRRGSNASSEYSMHAETVHPDSESDVRIYQRRHRDTSCKSDTQFKIRHTS